MKIGLFAISCIFGLMQSSPKVTFQSKVHDFGVIDMPWIVYHTFIFKNSGTDTLYINKTEAHCGCTTPEWKKRAIPAGKTDSIRVGFYPKNDYDTFEKDVYVFFSNQEVPETLTVKGRVDHSKF